MKNDCNDRIVYSINVNDIQEVAQQVLERNITKEEVILVEESIGDYLDWFQAIENSILERITKWSLHCYYRCEWICYGQDTKPDKSDYLKLCGQRFWEFISGNENLYTDIIEPLGHKAREKNDEFAEEYAKVINKFTREFASEYCDNDGSILWVKLVKFNSGKSSDN